MLPIALSQGRPAWSAIPDGNGEIPTVAGK